VPRLQLHGDPLREYFGAPLEMPTKGQGILERFHRWQSASSSSCSSLHFEAEYVGFL
jgi:hypothetical protein